MEELSDEELVARIRLAPAAERSRRLLDELFRRHRAQVVAWCYRLTGDRTLVAVGFFVEDVYVLDTTR
jgi:hypothetical protein